MTDDRPAGWYPAPHADNALRYWDGTHWLDWTPEQAAEAAARLVRPPVPSEARAESSVTAEPTSEPRSDSDDQSAPLSHARTLSGAAPSGRNRRAWVIAGAAAALLVVGGIAALVVALIQPTAIGRAGEACSGTKPLQALIDEINASASPDTDGDSETDMDEFAEIFEGVVEVEDDGTTLIVNTKPTDDDVLGVTALALDCVYEQLDVPTHITERIASTRALDGRQDGSWDGFTATWSYHPDSGANLIIVQE